MFADAAGYTARLAAYFAERERDISDSKRALCPCSAALSGTGCMRRPRARRRRSRSRTTRPKARDPDPDGPSRPSNIINLKGAGRWAR